MKLNRLIAFLYAWMTPRIVDGDGGGAVDVPEVAAEPAAEVAAPAAETKPGSMLEAMFPKDQGLDANGQPRDPLGRFAPKAADPAQAAQPAAKAAVPGTAVPAVPAAKVPDPLAMPDGLTPKAQERFQYLANTNKELQAEVAKLQPLAQLAPQVEYIRETFQKNGIQQEQFEQATAVLGMMNSGDFKGARDVLLEQLRLVSLAIGEPVPQVDALAGHPDLRQAVDGLQITEAHAIELARARMSQQATGQRMEQQRTQQDQQAQQQQAFEQGLQSVDALGKRLAASDLDWPRIEAILQPEIQNICRDLPPAKWASAIEAQYRLLKQVAGASRTPASGANVLRPTGQASPAARPQSAYEAMWGAPRPSV